ncbi:hypothetical protein TKK_0007252 [Trichogramma kaykai]|uniref:WD repeat-containing protein 55 homolog n=1 Tax=Trichogramma kaykai TaxID=54128 RepID=A0ABD2X955_9HYME
MQFDQTVMSLPNMSVPPPTVLSAPPPTPVNIPPPALPQIPGTASNYVRHPGKGFFKSFKPYHAPKIASSQDVVQDEFDGKRLRKSVMRKTVDYNSGIIKALENRVWQRDYRDRQALQPDVIYTPDLLPPPSYMDNPINCVTTKFVKTATNKMRCPIFSMAWTPEGRRLVTGASSGEFTLWNGLTYNFETILQAHDSPVRTMVWSHSESWMVTGDHAGFVKYWQSNMNNVKMFQAHKEAIRGLSFSPSDSKLATCSDDGTVRIWDFLRCQEERILRGHGADVKCVDWHPQKSLVVSGSKDNQQPVKLWDPKTSKSLATLHAHKSTVMDIKWNENGNWFITASRDHLLKLFDIRNLSSEIQTFRGHKKEVSCVAWHPYHEGLFCSGGSDGDILFWHVGTDKEVGAIEQAHDSIVWTLAWHPLGHILCSGSNDHTSKFWTRNRPGDTMRDKYNLNILPAGAEGVDDQETADKNLIIPGMGPEDRIVIEEDVEKDKENIPGLDLENVTDDSKKNVTKKVPYSKPIPRNFQAQWNEAEADDVEQAEALNTIVNQIIETTPGAVPLNEVTPNAIILYGKMIPVEAGSKLAEAITQGTEAINKLVLSGEIEELRNVVNVEQDIEESEDYLRDEGDVDYSKVPDVELPPPLASSKFAQNPELLNALNRGGKRKFEQLISAQDSNSNDKSSMSQSGFNRIEDARINDMAPSYFTTESSVKSHFDDQNKQYSGPDSMPGYSNFSASSSSFNNSLNNPLNQKYLGSNKIKTENNMHESFDYKHMPPRGPNSFFNSNSDEINSHNMPRGNWSSFPPPPPNMPMGIPPQNQNQMRYPPHNNFQNNPNMRHMGNNSNHQSHGNFSSPPPPFFRGQNRNENNYNRLPNFGNQNQNQNSFNRNEFKRVRR